MLSVDHTLPQATLFSKLTQQAGQASAALLSDREEMPRIRAGGGGLTRIGDTPETDRDVAGASLSQLIDALSAAITRDTCMNGEWITVALAEAAVLERELSSTIPRRWRIQQALNVLLKIGPNVTVALATVLEHPEARAHIARMFSS